MPSGTYGFFVDWGNDGSFLGTGEDLTTRTLRVECQRGRDVDSAITGLSIAGSLSAIVNNNSGDYNSFNSTGSLYGSLLPGRKVQLRTYIQPFPATFSLVFGQPVWTGYVSRIQPNPKAKDLNTVTIEAAGPLGLISQVMISTPPTSNIDTGAAISSVLNEAKWSTASADRDIDTGKSTIFRFVINRMNALDAARKAEVTESGFIRENATGAIVFENRHRRMGGTYTTAQATFTDSPTGTLVYQEIEQEDPLQFIFNDFPATITPYTTGSLGVLWTLAFTGTSSPTIDPNGGTRIIWAQFPNATSSVNVAGADSWTTPSATLDFQVFSDAAGTGTDLTGSVTMSGTAYMQQFRIVLTNNAKALGYITKLQARGVPLLKGDPVIVASIDGSSQVTYGARTFANRSQFITSVDEATYWGDWNKSIYKDPTKRFVMTFVANQSSAGITQALTREVSDRIHLIATGTRSGLGINGDFHIERIQHKIDAKNRQHIVIFHLSDATAFADGWALDISTLNTNTKVAY